MGVGLVPPGWRGGTTGWGASSSWCWPHGSLASPSTAPRTTVSGFLPVQLACHQMVRLDSFVLARNRHTQTRWPCSAAGKRLCTFLLPFPPTCCPLALTSPEGRIWSDTHILHALFCLCCRLTNYPKPGDQKKDKSMRRGDRSVTRAGLGRDSTSVLHVNSREAAQHLRVIQRPGARIG